MGLAVLRKEKRKQARSKRAYRKPGVKTSSGNQIVRKLGPAQTCSPSPQQCQTSF